MNTQKHTPTPWKKEKNAVVKDSVVIFDQSKMLNGVNTIDEIEANAQFIVKACNSHYQLLEACNEAMIIIDKYGIEQGKYFSIVDKLEKALAQAESK